MNIERVKASKFYKPIILLACTILLIIIAASNNMWRSRESVELQLPNMVSIGVISPTYEDFPKYEFFVNIAEQEINNYTLESGLETTFEFDLYSGEGTAAKSLELIQLLHEGGVDLVVGGGWSSQLCAMETYVNVNGVVVISPSSTSSQSHLVKSDNIFRLSPHDFMLGDDMANIISQYGVRAVVVIAREDAWGEGVAGRFGVCFEEIGGIVLGDVLYSPFLEDGYGHYLDKAEMIIMDSLEDFSLDEIGVFLLCFSEVAEILRETPEYPWLRNVTWFGSDSVANQLQALEAADEAARVKMISPIPLPRTGEYTKWVTRFSDQFQSHIDFYSANIYDACWVMALSVLEAGSVDSAMVADVFSDVAAEYSGMTGRCILDEFGDRSSYTLGVYGIDENMGSGPRWFLFGLYDSVTENVMWEKEYAPFIE